jgi:hypothetical protein
MFGSSSGFAFSTHPSIPGPSFPLLKRKGRKGEMQLILFSLPFPRQGKGGSGKAGTG